MRIDVPPLDRPMAGLGQRRLDRDGPGLSEKVCSAPLAFRSAAEVWSNVGPTPASVDPNSLSDWRWLKGDLREVPPWCDRRPTDHVVALLALSQRHGFDSPRCLGITGVTSAAGRPLPRRNGHRNSRRRPSPPCRLMESALSRATPALQAIVSIMCPVLPFTTAHKLTSGKANGGFAPRRRRRTPAGAEQAVDGLDPLPRLS